MTSGSSGGDPEETGRSAPYDSLVLGLQRAYREVLLHSPQAVPEVEERLSGKLASHGIILTPDILRALAFAIVNDRGF